MKKEISIIYIIKKDKKDKNEFGNVLNFLLSKINKWNYLEYYREKEILRFKASFLEIPNSNIYASCVEGKEYFAYIITIKNKQFAADFLEKNKFKLKLLMLDAYKYLDYSYAYVDNLNAQDILIDEKLKNEHCISIDVSNVNGNEILWTKYGKDCV